MYEEEADVTELEDEFYDKFFIIEKNPYLKENMLCWKIFLHQPSWKEFLLNEIFRKNLSLDLKKMWGIKKFSDFEEYIAFNKIDERKNKKIFVSREQKQMHEYILSRLDKNNLSTNLENPISMEYYLKYYFEYAFENEEYIYEINDKAQKKQSLRENIIFSVSFTLLIILLYIIVSLIINLTDISNNDLEQMETVSYNQETIDREIDDIIEKYNEWSTKEINNK